MHSPYSIMLLREGAPGDAGARGAALHRFPDAPAMQGKERRKASVALKTEIRRMKLFVLASNVLPICPHYGTPAILNELCSHRPHTCPTTGFGRKPLCKMPSFRELTPDCPWASQNPAALVLSIPNPWGKEMEEKLSLPGNGGGKWCKKWSAASECFTERTQGKTTKIASTGISQLLSVWLQICKCSFNAVYFAQIM